MSNMSNYLETQLYNHVLRATVFTPPASLFVAAYTSDPGKTDAGTEVSGGAYARKAVTFAAPSDGAGVNPADVLFDVATASWGNVTHFGIRDAASGGNLLFFGPANPAKTIAQGDQLKIPAGSIAAAMR